MIRSALTLSMMTGKPFTVHRVRARRSRPGLLRQHLTALNAASQISNAAVTGNALKSDCFSFVPESPRGGEYRFEIGTAGSTILVAQTLIPALMLADSPSTVRILGGTHNCGAPPFEFFNECYLPLLANMGGRVATKLLRHGFYPAGGGEIVLQIEPVENLKGIKMVDPIVDWRPKVDVLLSRLPKSIADREVALIRTKTDWRRDCFCTHEVDGSPGPGNVVLIRLASERLTELFTGFGEIKKSAEQVAREAIREANRHIRSTAPVGPHLADQLILPGAIAAAQGMASEYLTSELTQHSTTHFDVVRKFLDVETATTKTDSGYLIKIG